jgi:large subunit ribosomal protein L21e
MGFLQYGEMTGKRIGGYRRRTRYKISKTVRDKGKLSFTKYFQTLKEGDKVQLSLEASIHKGIFHPRYNGKVGVVLNKDGECYNVLIKDIKKEKVVLVHPIHLTKQH